MTEFRRPSMLAGGSTFPWPVHRYADPGIFELARGGTAPHLPGQIIARPNESRTTGPTPSFPVLSHGLRARPPLTSRCPSPPQEIHL